MGEEKERLVYTVSHALNCHGIRWRPCLYVYIRILVMSQTLHVDVFVSWHSVRASFILRCSMPSGSWISQEEVQERTGCHH